MYSIDRLADHQSGPKLDRYVGWCIPGIIIERKSGDELVLCMQVYVSHRPAVK